MSTSGDTAVVREIADLPGPGGLPVVGNALQLDAAHMHRTFEAWERRFGSIYRLRMGPHPFVVTSDSGLIASILKERPGRFRRFSKMAQIFAETGLEAVFPAEGDAWRRQRQLWMQAMAAPKLRTFHQGLFTVTERLLRRWRNAASARTVIDLQADLMRYTVDVTMRFALGFDANTLESTGGVIQQHLDKIFPAIGRRISAPVPYWRWFKLPADRELDRAIEGALKEVHALIAAARARIAAHPELRTSPSCLLEALIAAQDADATQLSDQELFGNALAALLAGEDTTANTLAWMVWFIAQHADVQQHLQEEADAATGGADLLSDPGALERVPFLDAVMNETLRLKPVAPIMMVEANEDVVLGGVRLPAGTGIVQLMRLGGLKDSEYPDPLAFKPERGWARQPSDPGAVRPTMPFGFGPRICPGRNLAVTEVRSVTTMLMRNFSVELVPGSAPVDERLAFTMMPTNLRIRLTERSKSR
ncbi:MAG TPA: cytochrome P450 [Nevskiaceae bacterium]|nr:cytochrome P450 [Nevskiaceae bacterium]